MPRSKNSESTGIKKEKLTTNPIKAPPAQKAKDATKKAAKTLKKHGNKENNTSSGTTGQQHAKPSQQKSEGVNRQREASPDVDALKARIKELEGASNCLFSITGILIFCNTDSPCLQRLLEHKRVLRLRRS
jgi:cystathionine beta-lyase/cystathionine gamma-synthase